MTARSGVASGETSAGDHAADRAPQPRVSVDAQTRRLFLAVFFLTLFVYLVSARGIPTTFDEQIVYDTTSSLVHGRAGIHTELLDQFPGLAVNGSDGTKVGIYGIGTSAVGAPLLKVGQAIAWVSPDSKHDAIVVATTMFANAFITAATVLVLMYLCFLLGASPFGAVLIGVSFGIGSYAFPHTVTLFTEPGTALFVVAAALFAVRASRSAATIDLFVCGACAATALLFRVSAGLFLPIFGIWLLVVGARARDAPRPDVPRLDVRRAVRFGAGYAAGAAAPLLLLLAVNWWRYGSPWNVGYTFSSATRGPYPVLRGLAGQWLSPGKSLFLYAPFAIVAVLGVVRSFRKLPFEMSLLAAIVGANAVFFARVQFWSGDWAWGPRYMQIVLPCLAAMAAPLMDGRLWRRALIVLTAIGVFLAALPAVLIRFVLVFQAAYIAEPPPSVQGPRDWDHSYYALVWHTWHFQPIVFHLRLLPHALANTIAGTSTPPNRNVDPSRYVAHFEMWWLRLHDIGGVAYATFTVACLGALGAGIWLLRSYFRERAPA